MQHQLLDNGVYSNEVRFAATMLPFRGSEGVRVVEPPAAKKTRTAASPSMGKVLAASVEFIESRRHCRAEDERTKISGIAQHHEGGQANKEWLDARVGIVTGSKCASLAGLNPYSSAARGVTDMVWPGKFTGNRMTQWGNDHEDTAEAALKNVLDPLKWGTRGEEDAEQALRAVLDHLGNGDYRIEHPGLVLSPHDGWTGVSPDGILIAPNGSRVLLEYKCPWRQRERTPESTEDLYPVCGRFGVPVPIQYMCQIQWGMRILDCASCYFVVWAPDPYPVAQTTRVIDKGHSKIYRTKNGVVQICCVKFDKEFCDELLEKCGKAWRERFVPAHVMREFGMLRHGQLEPELVV